MACAGPHEWPADVVMATTIEVDEMIWGNLSRARELGCCELNSPGYTPAGGVSDVCERLAIGTRDLKWRDRAWAT
jgi:hypothetical protein